MNSQSISVMLVDDHAVVRAGYKRFIELDPLLKVISEASSGEDAYSLLKLIPVDVVIMDLSMPGQGGFETLRRMVRSFPEQKILIFTMHENPYIAHQAFKLGAQGYLTKSTEPDLIVQAIHEVMAGGMPISKTIDAGFKEIKDTHLLHMELLPREFEIFIFLAMGESIEQISRKLNLSGKTAANYQVAIRKKLNARSTLDLYQYAKKHGLLNA